MKNVKYLEVEVSPFGFVKEENKNFCLRELVKKYQAKANAELKKAKARFMQHEKRVRATIKKNPEKAVAIAAAVGAALGAVAVGVMLKRRK